MTEGGAGTADGRSGDGAREQPVVLRPGYVVLGPEALPPATNVARPVPERLTHELVADEPYHLDRPGRDRPPDGVLPAGTPVAVLPGPPGGEDRVEDDLCRIVTATGLAVDVRRTVLRELPPAP